MLGQLVLPRKSVRDQVDVDFALNLGKTCAVFVGAGANSTVSTSRMQKKKKNAHLPRIGIMLLIAAVVAFVPRKTEPERH